MIAYWTTGDKMHGKRREVNLPKVLTHQEGSTFLSGGSVVPCFIEITNLGIASECDPMLIVLLLQQDVILDSKSLRGKDVARMTLMSWKFIQQYLWLHWNPHEAQKIPWGNWDQVLKSAQKMKWGPAYS